FVPAEERQRIAAAGIRNRHAGIAGDGDSRRHARHDLEWDALLMEKERFGSAAVEDERVAPLQARDGLALTRLLDQQITDRFLLQRLGRRAAEVDLFRVSARVGQELRRD